jgi:hypothetical protein
MGKLTIEQVQTEAERMAFIQLPWRVYRDDPLWVPPLISERVEFLDSSHHPFYKHADVVLFLARRDGDVVGTIAALINHRHNEYWDEKVGFFGLFEVLDDREAAEALLQTACDWVRDQGMTAIRGPAHFSTNEEIGLLVDGWDGPPVIMMTYNPRYYVDFIEGAGFNKAMDLLAYMADLTPYIKNGLPERTLRIAKKVRERRDLTVRPMNLRRFDEEVEHFKRIYNSAWSRNWGFVPMTDEEIDYIAVQLKQIIDPNLCHFILKDGKEIGAALVLPDLNEPLLKAYPSPDTPEWWTMLKLLWHWKVRRGTYTARAYAGGIIDTHRGVGADVVMAVAVIEGLVRKGYRYCESSWILENNMMMCRMAESYNSTVYRTYRVYEKALA